MHDVNPPGKDRAVKGTRESPKNLISSIYHEPDQLEAHICKLESKYALA